MEPLWCKDTLVLNHQTIIWNRELSDWKHQIAIKNAKFHNQVIQKPHRLFKIRQFGSFFQDYQCTFGTSKNISTILGWIWEQNTGLEAFPPYLNQGPQHSKNGPGSKWASKNQDYLSCFQTLLRDDLKERNAVSVVASKHFSDDGEQVPHALGFAATKWPQKATPLGRRWGRCRRQVVDVTVKKIFMIKYLW